VRSSVVSLVRIALLVALSLVLGYIESMIPLPVTLPGVKLGLANVVVLVALYVLDARVAFFLVFVKAGITAMLVGSPMVIAYSLAGGLLSFLLMWLLKSTSKVSIVVVSMVGAVAHNTAQVFVAYLLLATPAILLNLPFLAVVACITGSVTGTAALGVIKALPATARPPRLDRD
jgi:heptaprenyl diphosphate synthase